MQADSGLRHENESAYSMFGGDNLVNVAKRRMSPKSIEYVDCVTLPIKSAACEPKKCLGCGCSLQGTPETKTYCTRKCQARGYNWKNIKKTNSVKPSKVQKCAGCQLVVEFPGGNGKYCQACKDRHASPSPTSPFPSKHAQISSSTKGAALEMIVCADLLLRGFGVFRSVSPTCSCDLVVHAEKKLYRVEITAGVASPGGQISWARHDPENYDVLALVLRDYRVVYIPDIAATTPLVAHDRAITG